VPLPSGCGEEKAMSIRASVPAGDGDAGVVEPMAGDAGNRGQDAKSGEFEHEIWRNCWRRWRGRGR